MWSSTSLVSLCLLASSSSLASAYKLVHNYDYTNWYSSFDFQNLPDPTKGTVEYISLAEAQSSGLTRIIGKQVFMGVDNNTVIPASSSAGRKSIWIQGKPENDFLHGLLIGDFAHIPGSDCGSWPGFWTIRTNSGPYGEIDILESFSDNTQNFITLHTAGQCSFQAPANTQKGTPNENDFDCNLDGPGCSVKGVPGSYGDPFNKAGGGVYAMQWTSSFIKIFFFPRNAIPADITAGNPDPTKWGLPNANFDSQSGDCNIDANFPAQTIMFDHTFCGGNAGGDSWTSWTDCSAKTKVSTCEAFVRTTPHAFDEAYWLVNSVKVYQ